MTSENTKPIDDLKGAVNAAQYFSDILDVFNSAFPGLDYKRAFENADLLMKSLAVLMSEQADIVEKHDAVDEIATLGFTGPHHAIAGTSPDDVFKLLRKFQEEEAPSGKVGDVLHDRWVAAGESFIKGTHAHITEEQRSEYRNMRSKIDGMKKQYDLAISEIAQKRTDERRRVSQECGLSAIISEIENINMEWEKAGITARALRPDPMTHYDDYVEWQREFVAAKNERAEKINALSVQACELQEKYLDPISEKSKAEYATQEPAKKAIELLEEEYRKQRREAGRKAIDAILSDSPVSQEAADKWASRQVVVASAMKRLINTGTYKDKEDLCRDMAEFYRLTGGRLGPVIIQTTGRRRANAAHWDAIINIDGCFTKRTLFHEMGHLLEKDETVREAGCAFRNKRANMAKGLKSLRSLTRNSGYKSGEVAYTDDFWDPYIGKYYGGAVGSEVISMGMQMFSEPGKAGFLAMRDPQMFNLMIGIMKSSQSEREKKQTVVFSERVSAKQGEKANLESFYDKLSKFAKDEEKLLKHSSGLVHSIEGYGRGGPKGNGKAMIAYYYPGDPQGPGTYMQSHFFKTRQAARNFAYLYLLYIQKGLINSREEASRATFFLADAAWKKMLPPRLKTEDLHKFIEDLK